jgi:N-acylglucosamine-6-phosphate 2-epimerase
MSVLEALEGGLIVSVQAHSGSALDDPHVLAALARAAQDAGARAVRIAGTVNLHAVRRRVDVPIIGIIKRAYPGYAPYITATLNEVRQALECGVQIVAFDATGRQRPDDSTTADVVQAIHAGGALAMADCATVADGPAARMAGADILATTLCGYTEETAGRSLPAFDVVSAYSQLQTFVICEGGIHQPAHAARAREAGAHAVVVGTAITNTEWLVQQYAAALGPQRSSQA